MGDKSPKNTAKGKQQKSAHKAVAKTAPSSAAAATPKK